MNDKKITALIENSIPKFITADYPRFTEFIKVYYSQQETPGEAYEFLANLLNYSNVDETTLEFLEHFSNQYLSGLSLETLEVIDKRNLVKNIKQFYQSVGTEASIKFLFRILFNEEITVYYPTVDILRASDGKWQNDFVIKVTNTNRDDGIKDLEGREIVGETSGARALVETVKTYISTNGFFVAELYLTDFDIFHPIIDFLPDEVVTGETIDGVVYSESIFTIINGYTISSNGFMLYPGDFVSIKSNTGVDVSVLVDSVYSGGIESIEIVEPGTGYAVNEYIDFTSNSGIRAKAKITGVDGSGGITEVTVLNEGYDYKTLPTPVINTVNGINALLFPVSSTIGAVKKLKFISFGVNYTGEDNDAFPYSFPINFSAIPSSVNPIQSLFIYDYNGTVGLNEAVVGSISGTSGIITRIDGNIVGVTMNSGEFIDGETITGPSGNAVIYKQSKPLISFSYGALGNYDGYFRNSDSFLSTDKKLQDSYYYQDFSYVINTSRPKEYWITPLKQLIHPAGAIVFSLLEETSDIFSSTIGGSITPLLDTTEFYKFNFDYPQYNDGELSSYSNTSISTYDEYELHEVGYLDSSYQVDPYFEELNIPRKSNNCFGSEILIGTYEYEFGVDETDVLAIDVNDDILIHTQG